MRGSSGHTLLLASLGTRLFYFQQGVVGRRELRSCGDTIFSARCCRKKRATYVAVEIRYYSKVL